MNYEEKLLTYLVDNYRKSRKDTGDNKTNRRTQAKPEKMYRKYSANDGEFEEISKLNQTVEALTERGFITCETETFGTRIQCIYMVDEKIKEIEQYLRQKYGYVSKDMQLLELDNLVKQYGNASPTCKKECDLLVTCINQRKVPKNVEELSDILKAVAFVEQNREELYLREASMKIYGDSKYFENETLQPVCTILRKHSGRPHDEAEMPDEILRDYHIAREPQKLCLKGNLIIEIAGKSVDISGFSSGIEIQASDLSEITGLYIKGKRFMTIENRTSYLRYQEKNTVTFYLGGYANRYQRDLIKMVYRENPNLVYLHFGDIDAGGFWIHHNLCEITGVTFELFSMSVEELQKEEYQACLHPLTENDRGRLQVLKDIAAYQKVVTYMLNNSVKLEQEIVSLSLMDNEVGEGV